MEGDPNVGSSSSSAIKKRRRPSEVWNEMIKCKDGKAKCMHCGRLFDGSSKKGTTHLKNHLGRCPAKKRKGPGGDDQDQSLSPSVKTKELASLIRKKSLVGLIKHFNTERDTSDEDFEHLSDTEGDSSDEEWEAWDDLDPGLLYSRKDEILQLYQEEKEKLCQFLNNLSCRFSLGLVPYDFDYGEAPVGYFLVVYYIDDSWKWQSKIISALNDYPDRKNLIEALKSWKIDRNKCSALLLLPDQIRPSDHGDDQIGKMESWFSQQGSLPFASLIPDADHLMEYIDGILSSKDYFKDGIQSLKECAHYVYNKSTSDKLNRLDLAVKVAISCLKEGPSISLDGDFIRYFEEAVGLKEVFLALEQFDSDFRSINLTKQKWDELTATFERLKFLDDVAAGFLGRTGDVPIIVDHPYVHKILTDRCNHTVEDCLFCKEVMNDVIDRFFSKYYLVRVIALILDPRFRMDGVQLHYKEIYGSDADRYIEKVNKDFRDVYDAYAATDSSNSKSYEMLDARGRPSSPKSELDRYFNLLKVPRDHQLDVLAWWRGNAPFYPTLARMARDYLALNEKLLFLDNEVVPDDVIDMADQIAGFDLEERGLGEIISPLVCLKGFLGTAEN